QVRVVLHGEVLSPDRRIRGVVVELDDAVEGIPRLLLPREDVDEERGNGDGRHGRQHGDENGNRESARHSRCPTSLWHFVQVRPSSSPPRWAGSIDSVSSKWQVRHASSVTSWLRGVIRSGSGYRPVVK